MVFEAYFVKIHIALNMIVLYNYTISIIDFPKKVSDTIVVFRDEDTATTKIAEFMANSAASLHLTTKYIYSLSYDRFYKCDVKDVFKVALNNIFHPEVLSVLNLQITGSHCAPVHTVQYDRIQSIMLYSFAVRLPMLQQMQHEKSCLNDEQIRSIYHKILQYGAQNHRNVVTESFDDIRKLVRKNKSLPVYQPDWYMTYLYESIPEFAEINNGNMFFLGAINMLFPMFYLHMQEELKRYIELLPQNPAI